MAFPVHDGTVVDFGNGLAAQVADEAGAVTLYVYPHLATTTGRDSDGNVPREIRLTKTQVDDFIAAFQTV